MGMIKNVVLIIKLLFSRMNNDSNPDVFDDTCLTRPDSARQNDR